MRTVTPVAKVGPDDVLLRETENPQSAASHGGVNHNAGVGHHVRPFEQLHPATREPRPGEHWGCGGAQVTCFSCFLFMMELPHFAWYYLNAAH